MEGEKVMSSKKMHSDKDSRLHNYEVVKTDALLKNIKMVVQEELQDVRNTNQEQLTSESIREIIQEELQKFSMENERLNANESESSNDLDTKIQNVKQIYDQLTESKVMTEYIQPLLNLYGKAYFKNIIMEGMAKMTENNTNFERLVSEAVKTMEGNETLKNSLTELVAKETNKTDEVDKQKVSNVIDQLFSNGNMEKLFSQFMDSVSDDKNEE